MSLFDSASLVVTPNGYKEDKLYSIKPTDGSGDLTVTRATTATRVNSEGLIEVVPYNFIQFSEQFDNAVWTKSVSTISANATIAPNGTLTADKFIANATNSTHQLFQTTDSNAYVFSVYAKAGEETVFSMWIANATKRAEFNLATGTIPLSTVTNSTIVDVGNGWYRCSVYDTSPSTTYRIYGRTGGIYLGNGVDGLFLWGAQLNTGTSAKEYFPTTDRLDVPRLDYTNSSCPSILVEPQRTNLVTYSEAFNDTSWNVASTSTVTLNSGIAPNGTNTANLITATSVDGRRIKSLSLSAGTYTYSYFVKKGNQSSIQVLAFNSTLSAVAQSANFDLDNGTLTSGTGTIQQFTNGWYKVSVTFTIAATNTILLYIKSGLANNAIGSTVYAWGAQLEAGSNATSYIPTVASTVTRNADVISKTGISGLIGQTEGTLFAEVNINNWETSTRVLGISNGTVDNRIIILLNSSNRLRALITNVAVLQTDINTSTLTNGIYKIAIAYKANDVVFYVNGVLIGSDTSVSIPACSAVYLGKNENSDSTNFLNNRINSALIWKERLTDTELATLTTL